MVRPCEACDRPSAAFVAPNCAADFHGTAPGTRRCPPCSAVHDARLRVAKRSERRRVAGAAGTPSAWALAPALPATGPAAPQGHTPLATRLGVAAESGEKEMLAGGRRTDCGLAPQSQQEHQHRRVVVQGFCQGCCSMTMSVALSSTGGWALACRGCGPGSSPGDRERLSVRGDRHGLVGLASRPAADRWSGGPCAL